MVRLGEWGVLRQRRGRAYGSIVSCFSWSNVTEFSPLWAIWQTVFGVLSPPMMRATCTQLRLPGTEER